MELLCGGCGGTLSVEDAAGSEQRCPHCGRAIRVPGAAPAEGAGQDTPVTPLPEGDDLADEFLTKARLALKKKLLVVCGSCGERLTVEQHLAGNGARGPACGGQIRIPAPSHYEEPLEPEDLMTQAESPKEALDAAERLLKSRELRSYEDSTTRTGEYNPWTGLFELIVEPRLSDAAYTGYSATAWYLIANQIGQAQTVVGSFLNGVTTPHIERIDPSTMPDYLMGMKWRVYGDFDADVIGWRGMIKNDGA